MVKQPQSNDASRALADRAVYISAPALVTGSRRGRWQRILLGGALAVVACVASICLISAFASLYVAGEQDDIAVVIDSVMRAMAARDADRADDLFADNAQHAEFQANLESSLTGAGFALYEGYSAVEVSNITVGVQSSTDPAEPHGTVAQVSGLVHYTDGFVGNFDAMLVNEQGAWRLWSMNINISPERLEDYLRRHP